MTRLINCTLSDKELIDNVRKYLSYICKECKVPTMSIPARPNEDFDRFEDLSTYNYHE